MTRLAFLGSPEAAVVPLRALQGAGHDVALVVTAPDRRRGRGGALVPTPVKRCALELGIPVSSRVGDVVDARVEIGVVVAFGTLIRPEILTQVPMANLHFSLLPRWRGAAPVERAILAGDDRTGVCLMALEETLDTGPVYSCVEVPIRPGETAAELKWRLADIGADLLVERLAGGIATLGTPVPQQGEAVYAAKMDRAELHLDWERPAVELERLVRVGRAWTTFRERRLIVERARVVIPAGGAGAEPDRLAPGTLLGAEVVCGVGSLELLEVRSEARSVQAFGAWRHGSRPVAGERFGD
ncbi:MAG: methionyl-tRNA formyltransferase [Acidimicrobiales bacterium]